MTPLDNIQASAYISESDGVVATESVAPNASEFKVVVATNNVVILERLEGSAAPRFTSVGEEPGYAASLNRAFIRQLLQFEKLPLGWDTRDAEPPNKRAIERAILIVQALASMGVNPKRVAPTAEGGIVIWVGIADRWGRFESFNTGEVIAVLSDPSGESSIYEASDNEGDIRDAVDAFIESLEVGPPAENVFSWEGNRQLFPTG